MKCFSCGARGDLLPQASRLKNPRQAQPHQTPPPLKGAILHHFFRPFQTLKSLGRPVTKEHTPYNVIKKTELKLISHQHMPRTEVTSVHPSPHFQSGQGITPDTLLPKSAISVLRNRSGLDGQGKAEHLPGFACRAPQPAQAPQQHQADQFDDKHTATLQQHGSGLLFLQETFFELFTPGIELILVPSPCSRSILTSQTHFPCLWLVAVSKSGSTFMSEHPTAASTAELQAGQKMRKPCLLCIKLGGRRGKMGVGVCMCKSVQALARGLVSCRLTARPGFSPGQLVSTTTQHGYFANSSPLHSSGCTLLCARLRASTPCPAAPREGRGSHCRKLSSLAWLLLEEPMEGAADAGLVTFFFLLLTAKGWISARFVWR